MDSHTRDTFEELARRELAAARLLRNQLQEAVARYDAAVAAVTEDRRRLDAAVDEPTVYVRRFRAGPRPRVFHATPECGWCPEGALAVPRPEAEARGLAQCSSRFCSPTRRAT